VMIALMKLADEMRALFTRWKSSSLSLMAFGKAEGVSYSKLLYWRDKLGDEARKKPKRAKTTDPSSFAPLRIVPDSTPVESRSDKFEIWLANGISIDIAPGFDEHEVRRLVGVLLAC